MDYEYQTRIHRAAAIIFRIPRRALDTNRVENEGAARGENPRLRMGSNGY